MSRKIQGSLFKSLLVFMTLVLGFSGFGFAIAPAFAQGGNQGNAQACSLLYAVQQGDTLTGITQQFNLDQSSLMQMNPLLQSRQNKGVSDQQLIFPGLVLCVSNTPNPVLPNTGAQNQQGQSNQNQTQQAQPSAQQAQPSAQQAQPSAQQAQSLTVMAVNPSQKAVVLQAKGLPTDQQISIVMSDASQTNGTMYQVAAFIVPQGQNQVVQKVNIPQQLANVGEIQVAYQNMSNEQKITSATFNPAQQMGQAPADVVDLTQETVQPLNQAQQSQQGQQSQSQQGQSSSQANQSQQGQSSSQANQAQSQNQQGLVLAGSSYAQCQVLYAVQQGDTIASLTGKYSLTQDELVKMNPELQNAAQSSQGLQNSDLFPGLVVCLSNQAGASVLPLTGQQSQQGQSQQGQSQQGQAQSSQQGQASLTVLAVDPSKESATLQVAGLPANQKLAIVMSDATQSNPQMYQVATFTTTQGQNQVVQTVNIPTELANASQIKVDYQNTQNQKMLASQVFDPSQQMGQAPTNAVDLTQETVQPLNQAQPSQQGQQSQPQQGQSSSQANQSSAAAGQNQANQNQPYAQCQALYAIQQGDTLASLTGQFNLTQQQLENMNPDLKAAAQGSQGLQDSDLVPGLVVCVSNQPGAVLPLTGAPSQQQAQPPAQQAQPPAQQSQPSTQQGQQTQQQGQQTQQQGQQTQQQGQQTQQQGQQTQQQGQQTQQQSQTPAQQQSQTPAQPAQPTKKQAATIAMGNEGVFSPYGLDKSALSVTKVERNEEGQVRFLMPLLQISSKNSGVPATMTYVFFNVNMNEVHELGGKTKSPQDLGIWYKAGNGNWQRCGTSFVVDGSMKASNSKSGNSQARIACVAPNLNATYGVGFTK